jgi:hypothetical protein
MLRALAHGSGCRQAAFAQLVLFPRHVGPEARYIVLRPRQIALEAVALELQADIGIAESLRIAEGGLHLAKIAF